MLCAPPGAAAEVRAFYGGLLGLEEIPKPEAYRDAPYLWYHMGDIDLHVGLTGKAEDDERHVAFAVDGLRELRERLETAGFRTRNHTPLPDRERFSFYDPFGNRIEVISFHPA